jgi:glycosyltransferase involved in cell wall biosynthesis
MIEDRQDESTENFKLSIIIPCYNEQDTIAEVVRRVENSPVKNKEIIIVDNCSTDKTREILAQIGDKHKIILQSRNMGKGASIKEGLKHMTGDFVLVQDADLEYNPNQYPKLLEPLLLGKADIVYGSRFIGGDSHRVDFFWHYVGNRVLTVFANMITNINLTDMETCYKVFRRDIVKSINLHENGFGFDVEISIKTSKLRVRIYEVGIDYDSRTYSEGKKIGWKDGVWALWCIVKYGLFG